MPPVVNVKLALSLSPVPLTNVYVCESSPNVIVVKLPIVVPVAVFSLILSLPNTIFVGG